MTCFLWPLSPLFWRRVFALDSKNRLFAAFFFFFFFLFLKAMRKAFLNQVPHRSAMSAKKFSSVFGVSGVVEAFRAAAPKFGVSVFLTVAIGFVVTNIVTRFIWESRRSSCRGCESECLRTTNDGRHAHAATEGRLDTDEADVRDGTGRGHVRSRKTRFARLR